MVFGSMAITLAIAESIYFIPRIYGLITTGLVMMYAETGMMDKKKMAKKGKQIAKKMGIM